MFTFYNSYKTIKSQSVTNASLCLLFIIEIKKNVKNPEIVAEEARGTQVI